MAAQRVEGSCDRSDDVRISVVVVTWNRCEDLMELLECLFMQDFDGFEIVVVDNDSTDSTAEVIPQRFPCVRYIRLPFNSGLSAGRNIGVVNSLGEMIFFLDNDIVVYDPQLLTKAHRRLMQRPDVSVISCNIINCTYDEGELLVPDCDASDGEHCLYDWFFRGGGSIFRRSVFEHVGYLDDFFRYGGEEWDMSYRLHQAGMRMLWSPDLQLFHKISPIQRPRKRFKALIYQNMVIAQLRYMPWLDILVFCLWQFPADFVRSVRDGWFFEYLKACMCIVRHLPRLLFSERRPVSRQVMQRWYHLRTHCTSEDYAEVEASRMDVIDYYTQQWRLRRLARSH